MNTVVNTCLASLPKFGLPEVYIRTVDIYEVANAEQLVHTYPSLRGLTL
jgi:hypothetical protein